MLMLKDRRWVKETMDRSIQLAHGDEGLITPGSWQPLRQQAEALQLV
jgi:hypothetical protein